MLLHRTVFVFFLTVLHVKQDSLPLCPSELNQLIYSLHAHLCCSIIGKIATGQTFGNGYRTIIRVQRYKFFFKKLLYNGDYFRFREKKVKISYSTISPTFTL